MLAQGTLISPTTGTVTGRASDPEAGCASTVTEQKRGIIQQRLGQETRQLRVLPQPRRNPLRDPVAPAGTLASSARCVMPGPLRRAPGHPKHAPDAIRRQSQHTTGTTGPVGNLTWTCVETASEVDASTVLAHSAIED
jgi:hypothetical protein